MPRPASDALLTATVVPALNRHARRLDAVRQDVRGGSVLWDVNVSEFSERLTAQPDPPTGPPSPPPDPYIEADFTILQHGRQLVVTGWSISGSEIISTRKSRIPLQAYARAALLAVEDALEANAELTYKQMTAEHRGHASFFEMSKGKLRDPQTRQPRARRKHVYPTSGVHRLDLARIVDEYRKAVERGSRSPTVDVARAFNIGRSTAARKLAEAREQGLLGPALRNRAGER